MVYDQRVCPVRACLRASSHTPSRPSTVSFRNTDRRRGKNTVPLRSTEKGCTQPSTWHPSHSMARSYRHGILYAPWHASRRLFFRTKSVVFAEAEGWIPAQRRIRCDADRGRESSLSSGHGQQRREADDAVGRCRPQLRCF